MKHYPAHTQLDDLVLERVVLDCSQSRFKVPLKVNIQTWSVVSVPDDSCSKVAGDFTSEDESSAHFSRDNSSAFNSSQVIAVLGSRRWSSSRRSSSFFSSSVRGGTASDAMLSHRSSTSSIRSSGVSFISSDQSSARPMATSRTYPGYSNYGLVGRQQGQTGLARPITLAFQAQPIRPEACRPTA